MVNATGPDSDKGEMMRFLAELPWNPDAILNASALKWRQIDARTVEVSIQTAGGLAAVRHLFDENGDIAGIIADDRPYLIDGRTVPMQWIGRFRDYADFSERLPRGIRASGGDFKASSNYFMARVRVSIGGAEARGLALLSRSDVGWPAIVWRKYE